MTVCKIACCMMKRQGLTHTGKKKINLQMKWGTCESTTQLGMRPPSWLSMLVLAVDEKADAVLCRRGSFVGMGATGTLSAALA